MTNKKIDLASIVVVVATGLMALSPSIMIANAQAQLYSNEYGYDNNYYYQDDNRYTYDKKDSKSSHVDIQKIKCVNSNINVNGIDITQLLQDNTALGAANEGGAAADAPNTQNYNGIADRINFDRNLVNICINVNVNDQIRSSTPIELTCEECFTQNLDTEQQNELLTQIGELPSLTSFEQLCQFISASVDNNDQENLQSVSNTLFLAFERAQLSTEYDAVFNCLNDVFNNAIPPHEIP